MKKLLIRSFVPIALLLFSLAIVSQSHALTIELNQSNADLGITGNYLSTEVVVLNGVASFYVKADTSLLEPGSNFGIQAFGFNSSLAFTADQFFLPPGWRAYIAPKRSLSMFGRFDYGATGRTRMDPFEFAITGLVPTATEEDFNTQNAQGYTMVARVAGFESLNGKTSSWFSNGPFGVAEPNVILLLGAGLIGLARLKRDKLLKK